MQCLVVDDHAIVRRGLKEILVDEFRGAEVGEAQNAQEAFELILHKGWDVVVMDITMPGRSGLDLLKEVKRACPKLPVLILSIHPEEQLAVRVLKAGASGYMTKETAPDELVSAVRKVIAGGKYVSGTLAEMLASGLEAAGDGRPLHERLSDREYEVFRLIASGLTVSEIAGDLSLSVKTVSTYRARVLEKMKMKTNAELMNYALKNELVV